MFQIICEYQVTWPKDGPLRVEAQFAGEIKVSPTAARRRAAGFLAGHVTMMVLAGEPVLVWSEQPVWRVPACLHLPDLGEVSTVGSIDVDALTGEIMPLSSDQIAAMQRRANDIATRFTLPAAPTS
jgi:hypothetical protein